MPSKSKKHKSAAMPQKKTEQPIQQKPQTIPSSDGEELDRIASEIAMELNADPTEEEVQRLAVFQAAANRVRQQATPISSQSQIDRINKEQQKMTEMTDEELALQYGLEPTTIENLKATQPDWEKTLGRRVSLEEVYFLEFDQPEQV